VVERVISLLLLGRSLEMVRYRVVKKVEGVDASHKLAEAPNSESPCLRRHGHRYDFEFTISSDELYYGMVVDFTDISDVAKRYDHRDLNDWIRQPTAENLITLVYEALVDKLKDYPNSPLIEKIGCWETPTGYAEAVYYEADGREAS
jgi:6-pyruvoyl-tetrahydropterin synthase